MKIVIIGGVAVGATAAARIRRLDEQARIVVFERSGYISYANCGLPYYIGDVITDPGREFEESYDKLILSPGAKPAQPRLPGTDMDKLFTLRTVEDTFRIKEYINHNHPKSAVLAGGGFIGLELAETAVIREVWAAPSLRCLK